MSARASVLVTAAAAGAALRLAEPLSLWGGFDPERGVVIETRHPQCGAVLAGRVVVMAWGRGSSSSSSVLLEAVRARTAPAAFVLLEADGILALGALVARELYGRGPAVVVLGAAEHAAIPDGAVVSIEEDGTMTWS